MNDKEIEQEIFDVKLLQDDPIKLEWLVENCKAIEEYNRSVELHGVFSDGLRSF
jgi:Post-segregation antitoxin CcdA